VSISEVFWKNKSNFKVKPYYNDHSLTAEAWWSLFRNYFLTLETENWTKKLWSLLRGGQLTGVIQMVCDIIGGLGRGDSTKCHMNFLCFFEYQILMLLEVMLESKILLEKTLKIFSFFCQSLKSLKNTYLWMWTAEKCKIVPRKIWMALYF